MAWAALLVALCCLAPAWTNAHPYADPSASLNANMTEKQLLLTFRDGISNWAEVQAAWGLTGWCTGEDAGCKAPVCTWGGVTCSPYHTPSNVVTDLRLPCNGCKVPLQGKLRPGLHLMQHLEILYLQGNDLTGTLPLEWGEPDSFPALLELNFNQNQLSGTIMPETWPIGPAFPQLADLQLANNRFNGTFPAGFAITNTSFWSVMSFSFANNQLTGTLPNYINGMVTMSVVELHNNRFTGALPPDWGIQGYWWNATLNDTQALEYLTLHGNNLTGGIPEAWAQTASFAVLKQLTLSDNPRLGGGLPETWGNATEALQKLQDLNVSNCGLSGTLPEWSVGLPSLHTLTMYGNNLSGTVPASWAGLASLQDVAIQPGNPELCPVVPAGASFGLCDDQDLLCDGRYTLTTNSSSCQALIDNSTSTGGGGGGSSFPIAAVVAPLATVAVAIAGVLGLRWRRRRVAEARARARTASENEPVYKDAESGLYYTAAGMPLPPDFGARKGDSASGSCLPCFSRQSTHAEVLGLSDSTQSVPDPFPVPGYHPPGLPQLTGSPQAVTASTAGHSRSSGDGPSGLQRAMSELQRSGSLAGTMSSEEKGAEHPKFSAKELAVLQLSDWEIQPEEIRILKRPDGADWRLGSGGFGTVYKAMRNGVQPVAVKVLGTGSNEISKVMSDAEFAREISILRACRDPNILQFQGACVQSSRTVLVTEYMEGGNLTNNLRAKKVTWWRRGKKIALDVARALVYLHTRRIVHLDIKSANVLLSRDGTAKVGDVGMAKIMQGDYVSGVVGTLAWSAPELLMGQRCTAKADIYSLGVVLWEICTGELPVRGQLRDPRSPEECPVELIRLIYRCLNPDPAARPTAAELVELLQAAPGMPSAASLEESAKEDEETAACRQANGLGSRKASLAPGSSLASSAAVSKQNSLASPLPSLTLPGPWQEQQGSPAAQQQQQQQQQQQREAEQQHKRQDAPGSSQASMVFPPATPAAGVQVQRSGTVATSATLGTSTDELEKALVAELVAESAPNSGCFDSGTRLYLSGRPGRAGPAGVEHRLVLPVSGPLSAESPFQQLPIAPAPAAAAAAAAAGEPPPQQPQTNEPLRAVGIASPAPSPFLQMAASPFGGSTPGSR